LTRETAPTKMLQYLFPEGDSRRARALLKRGEGGSEPLRQRWFGLCELP
jgi:hypothetical protein